MRKPHTSYKCHPWKNSFLVFKGSRNSSAVQTSWNLVSEVSWMGIVTLQKRAQPGRKRGPSFFSSFRFQSMQVHLIQIMSLFPFCYSLFWISEEDTLGKTTSFFSLLLIHQNTSGIPLSPSKSWGKLIQPSQGPGCYWSPDCYQLGVHTAYWWRDWQDQNLK